MIKQFIQMFRMPSADQLRLLSLEEARRELHVAQCNAEYWQAMSTMLSERVQRLSPEPSIHSHSFAENIANAPAHFKRVKP